MLSTEMINILNTIEIIQKSIYVILLIVISICDTNNTIPGIKVFILAL